MKVNVEWVCVFELIVKYYFRKFELVFVMVNEFFFLVECGGRL